MGKKPQSPLCASCTGSSRAQQLPGEAFLGFESPAAGRAVLEAGQLLQHSACSPCTVPIHLLAGRGSNEPPKGQVSQKLLGCRLWLFTSLCSLESWADFEGAHRSHRPTSQSNWPTPCLPDLLQADRKALTERQAHRSLTAYLMCRLTDQ